MCALILAKSANLSNNIHTAPSTPKLPTRLSRIISNLRSRVLPPKSPSHESISPSRWSPPVSTTSIATSKAARTSCGTSGASISTSNQSSSASSKPTNGKYSQPITRRGVSSSLSKTRVLPGTGSTVRKRTAATNSIYWLRSTLLKGGKRFCVLDDCCFCLLYISRRSLFSPVLRGNSCQGRTLRELIRVHSMLIVQQGKYSARDSRLANR